MKTKLTTLLIIIAILIAGWYSYRFITADSRYIAENCPNYEHYTGFVDTVNFIDCSGSVGIGIWSDEEYPNIFNQTSEERYSFRVKNYTLDNGEIYYIEDYELTAPFPIYHVDLMERLGLDVAIVDNGDVPIFRKLNTITGDYTVYNSIADAPENERLIFEELTI